MKVFAEAFGVTHQIKRLGRQGYTAAMQMVLFTLILAATLLSRWLSSRFCGRNVEGFSPGSSRAWHCPRLCIRSGSREDYTPLPAVRAADFSTPWITEESPRIEPCFPRQFRAGLGRRLGWESISRTVSSTSSCALRFPWLGPSASRVPGSLRCYVRHRIALSAVIYSGSSFQMDHSDLPDHAEGGAVQYSDRLHARHAGDQQDADFHLSGRLYRGASPAN